MNSLLHTAARIAAVAHKEQVRKDEPTPYISHLIGVALILSRYDFSDEVIAAGLLHDVLEDTEYSSEQLRSEVGEAVFSIITAVTNDDSLSWEEKKKKYIETVRAAGDEAKAVATADKIQNAQSLILAHEKQGSAVWAYFNAGRDKKLWFENAMLAMLQATWKHPLVDEYATLVEKMNALA